MGKSRVALGEVTSLQKVFIQMEDSESYKRCRVQLHAQGVVLRDKILGVRTASRRTDSCRSRLAYAEILAAITRRHKTGDIDTSAFEEIRKAFKGDWESLCGRRDPPGGLPIH
jgi:hypothetical protein